MTAQGGQTSSQNFEHDERTHSWLVHSSISRCFVGGDAICQALRRNVPTGRFS